MFQRHLLQSLWTWLTGNRCLTETLLNNSFLMKGYALGVHLCSFQGGTFLPLDEYHLSQTAPCRAHRLQKRYCERQSQKQCGVSFSHTDEMQFLAIYCTNFLWGLAILACSACPLLQNHRCLICNWLEHCQFPLVSFCLFKIPLSKRRLTWSFFLNQFSLSKFLPCDSSSTRKDISVQALYFIFGMKLLKDWFQSYSYLPFQQRQIISKYFQLHS